MNNAAQDGQSNQANSASSESSSGAWAEAIKEQPMIFLAVAAAAGYIAGGGLRSNGGLAVLGLIGKIAANEALGDFLLKKPEASV